MWWSSVAIFSGVGSVLSGDVDLLDGVILGAVRGVVAWAVWALFTWIIGSTILKTPETEADWGQLARCTGFAQTPGLLNILVFIPVVGGLIYLAALVWTFVAMMVAVRQSLDYTSTWRAFFVILIAFIPAGIVNVIVFLLTGGADVMVGTA